MDSSLNSNISKNSIPTAKDLLKLSKEIPDLLINSEGNQESERYDESVDNISKQVSSSSKESKNTHNKKYVKPKYSSSAVEKSNDVLKANSTSDERLSNNVEHRDNLPSLETSTTSKKSQSTKTKEDKTEPDVVECKDSIENYNEEKATASGLTKDDHSLKSNAIPSTSKELESSSTKKVEKPKRTLRSGKQSKQISTDKKSAENFSIDDIEWYYKNEEDYKNKLKDILSNFEQDNSDDSKKNEKLFYNYLLLDTRKLPKELKNIEWKTFIDAIFYVGKGKNQRAYDHTKEAKKKWLLGYDKPKKKISKIYEIWKDKSSVMISKIVENVTDLEALTREASIIDAIGLKRLCNMKSSTYYGAASDMSPLEQCEIGTALLMQAFDMFSDNADYIYFDVLANPPSPG